MMMSSLCRRTPTTITTTTAFVVHVTRSFSPSSALSSSARFQSCCRRRLNYPASSSSSSFSPLSSSSSLISTLRGANSHKKRRGTATATATAVAETDEQVSVPIGTNNDEDNKSDTTDEVSVRSLYQELVKKLERITHLGRAQSVLSYDQLVFMPSSAGEERGKQMSALAGVVHEMKTDPKLKELLDRIWDDYLDDDNDNSNNNNNNGDKEQRYQLNDDERRLVELERKAIEENERVPVELAAKAAGLSTSAYSSWVEAKQKQNYAAFAPTLRECFDTAMMIADAKRGDDNSKISLYDQMLNEFEIGMGQKRIDEIFNEIQSALVPLISRVRQPSSKKPSSEPLEGKFDIESQRELSEKLVTAIGYDKDRGRIDVSVHPFSSSISGPSDVRITSRFRNDEWYQGLAGTLHEGGHAMYEQNLLPSGVSIDTPLSMGTHESQSLFWERHIGLSKPFWKFARPHLTEHLSSSFDNNKNEYTVDEIYGAVNRVQDFSYIRVEADELTYPLHVILRYNIEKDVIGGTLDVENISQRWNDDMKSLLNVDDVPSDDLGVLQDVHWSALAFGYFPTYLIGAIAAAQLYHYCQLDVPELERKIEVGDFTPIKDWLKMKVHRHGKRYPSLDRMFEDQLGEPLNPKYFIEYLTNKYTDLYQL